MQNSAKTPLVISYVRFSRPEQMQGDSLRRQTEAAAKWAKSKGLTITENIHDYGISAFRGKNRRTGALKAFVDAIEAGKVPRGSILVIEALDRLTRDEIEKAQEHFLSIINRGVEIVTLSDGQRYKQGQLRMEHLVISLMMLMRGHDESEMKSQRLKATWVEKRKDAAANGKMLTRRVPFWIDVTPGDKFKLNEHADLVREAFKMSAKGFGLIHVLKKLNAHYKGKGPTKTGRFSRSYMHKILTDGMVRGIYQPCVYEPVDGLMKRIPSGDPIVDYFPRAVTDELFFASNHGLSKRRSKRGRSSKYVNLFTGVLFNADDGSSLRMQSKVKGRRIYASSKAVDGAHDAAPFHCLPVPCVEVAILMQLSEMTEIAGPAEVEDNTAAIEGRLADVAVKTAKIIDQTMRDDVSSSVVALLGRLDARKAELERELSAARAKASVSSRTVKRETLRTLTELIHKVTEGKMSDDERHELRGVISRLVDRVELSTAKDGQTFLVEGFIKLADGRSSRFSFDARTRKAMNAAKRGYVTTLIDKQHRLEISIDAGGRCEIDHSKVP